MSPSTTTELAPKYDPAAVEAETYKVWLDEKCFEADPSKPGEAYSIVIPPPNVTGALHLGHAINNTLQDILTRVHRMRGFNTVWIPGIDHAGIATQAVVERTLKETEGLDRHQVGREALVEKIWAWKQQYGDRILSQLQRLGCSCDWSRTRFTLDDMCARAVRETFFKLFKDGLVYRGKRLVNWDTHLLTSISDDELYDEPVKTHLWSIKYRIRRGGVTPPSSTEITTQEGGETPPLRAEFMTVATTRPETLLADTAVAVHSQDSRWNWAIGMFVELPLTGRKIPIIADDILVDPTFGSGVVKVTPAHDANDYAVYQRHLGKPTEIAILNMMTPDGKVNDADPSWAQYTGLTFAQARKKIVEDLAAGGFHNPETDVKPHEANVKFSDRSKTAIQPYLSDQWFVKMAPLAEPALEVVRNGTIKFFPERHAQQYLSWLGEKRDWPISRQLWWGHRIPIWTIYFPHGANLSRFSDSEAPDRKFGEHVLSSFESLIGRAGLQKEVFARLEEGETEFMVHACASTDRGSQLLNAIARAYGPEKAKGASWVDELGVRGLEDQIDDFAAMLDAPPEQDPDVLDTWFSSALWPHSTLGWPDQTADLARWYPTSVLMTGRDIITLWVARMVMMGLYNMGHVGAGSPRPGTATNAEGGETPPLRGIPFHHVMINPTIMDGKGEPMKKSKGNGVDPVDIIDTYGADALRFTMTQMATETQDARLPVKKDANGKNTSDKFDGGRNFCTKLWNAARFVLTNLEQLSAPQEAPDVHPGLLIDRWIISRFNLAITDADEALKNYRFDQYHKACYDFFWRDFCDWYVEAAKPALKDPTRQAQTAHVLATVLDGILRLMHPMIPFITERLWWQLNAIRPTRGLPGRLECVPSKRLVHASWPMPGKAFEDAEFFPKIQEIVEAIRRVRNDYKVDPKKPVTVSIAAAAELKPLLDTNREVIELLAICTLGKVETALQSPKDAARATAAGVELFIEGVIDPEADKLRKAKEIESLTKKREALIARLANPSYADKAPAKLVQQTRDELAAVEAELAKLMQ